MDSDTNHGNTRSAQLGKWSIAQTVLCVSLLVGLAYPAAPVWSAAVTGAVADTDGDRPQPEEAVATADDNDSTEAHTAEAGNQKIPLGNDVAELLDPSRQADYGGDEVCILARQVKNVEVLDEQHLLFKGVRNQYWLNRLTDRCRGLRRDMLLVMERHGSRMCDKDRVKASHRMDFDLFAASCLLGRFAPITAEHAVTLRDTLENDRRNKRAESSRKRKEKNKTRKDSDEGAQPVPEATQASSAAAETRGDTGPRT